MANYVSTHTGAEIDAAVDAAIPFEAVYGSTTYAEIKAAHDAKRTVSARKGFQRFQLANFVAAAISFSLANAGTKTITLLTVTNADAWSETVLDIGAELAAIQNASAPAILNTASGAVCAFSDGSASPMTSVIANIVAKQDAPILPAGYWQLDYIASSGTQYIDTGYAVSVENMRYVGKFNFSAIDATMTWFGHQRGSIRSGQLYGNKGSVYAGSSNAIMQIGALTADTDYSVDLTVDNGNATLVANGVTQTATYEGTIIEATRSIYLFGLNSYGSMIYPISGKCYYFKMYQGTTLVRDFVPCIRQADGVLGMYDLVGGAFYANAGTGDFIAGPPTSRPITGYTGANVTRAGLNLAEADTFSGHNNLSGTLKAHVPAGQEIIISGIFNRDGTSTKKAVILLIYADGTTSGYFRFPCNSGTREASSGPWSTPKEVVAIGYYSNEDGWAASQNFTLTVTDFQIELGSTAHDYEPYAGEVFSVSWQDEAGTVYGGTVDLVSGVLTVTHKRVDLGTLTWAFKSGSTVVFRTSGLAALVKKPSADSVPIDAICDSFDVSSYSNVGLVTGKFGVSDTGTLAIMDSTHDNDLAGFQSAMNGVYLVYPLATAETYNLTPQEVASLLGDNSLWNDVNGDTSAEYRADTKLYIQSLLGA